jgi:cytidyltransferase-like protein
MGASYSVELPSVICLSGGFDPVHIGHVQMIQNARSRGDVVVVGVNSDDWLARKKGAPFMPFKERAIILGEFGSVDTVVAFNDSDNTANELIRDVVRDYPDHKIYFGNGGDRVEGNTAESSTCEMLGVEMLWSLGGEKIQSSSELLQAYNGRKKDGFNMQ